MRTTIDIPDELYRALKARAGLNGLKLRDLVQRLIEQGMRSPAGGEAQRKTPEAPPVIIAPRGVPIPALSRSALARLEDEEDETKHARLA